MVARSSASPTPIRPSPSAATQTWTIFVASPFGITRPRHCKTLQWPVTLPGRPRLAQRFTPLIGHPPHQGAPRPAFPSWSCRPPLRQIPRPLHLLLQISLPWIWTSFTRPTCNHQQKGAAQPPTPGSDQAFLVMWLSYTATHGHHSASPLSCRM